MAVMRRDSRTDTGRRGMGKKIIDGLVRAARDRILITDRSGEPGGYRDLYVYIPGMGQIIRITEGTGDNLLPEDLEQGYVDYIYYEQYQVDAGMPEVDGGIVLLKRMLREQYGCMADCIGDVLDMAYGDCMAGYMVLA